MILSGDIIRVTKKGLGDKTRHKKVEVWVNIVKLVVDCRTRMEVVVTPTSH